MTLVYLVMALARRGRGIPAFFLATLGPLATASTPHALDGADPTTCVLCHTLNARGGIAGNADGLATTAACLDCHQEHAIAGGGATGHARSHPVAVPYPVHRDDSYAVPLARTRDGVTLVAADSPVGAAVRLYPGDNRLLVQCASCHEPHGKRSALLRLSNDRSDLCLSCHRM